MPRWLPRLLKRIHTLAGRGQVRLTLKAARELAALGAGVDVQDACDVLVALAEDDFAHRFESEHTREAVAGAKQKRALAVLIGGRLAS